MQEVSQLPIENEHIFALDIGTRTVIGIVGRLVDGVFQVVATACQPHEKRAMFDGQIEDIEEVCRAAKLVKTRLEEKLGFKLRQVCVAAAGRALRTNRAMFELELNADEQIETNQIYQLEMGAIAVAQQEINSAATDGAPEMFCVGYSPVCYWLDAYKMTTIVGHKGKKAKVEVIATFLPNQVVQSLRSAMSLLSLSIINLTLEPIAAMNAVIPNDLRLLNLALVDIGAGTSDIAISNNGSVVAYTMATVAGDEITEAIMKKYLIDFATAEQMKIAAAAGEEEISYQNILGFEYTVSLAELTETIGPAVDGLAEEIAGRIAESNGGAPAAIFLVGGGSKTPLLPKLIAKKLGLDEQKVAVGGSNYMKKQATGNFDGNDPEYATPIGIAITAATYAKQHSAYVTVNNERVCLMRSAGFNVMNALLMSGFKYSQLMGQSGKSIGYTFNGENKLVRGGLPQPAQITVNGTAASISTPVDNGDSIVILPSVSGTDASVNTATLRTGKCFTVTMDNDTYLAGELLSVNGELLAADCNLENMDVVETKLVATLGELCAYYGLSLEDKGCFLESQMIEGSYCLQSGDYIVTKDTAVVQKEKEQFVKDNSFLETESVNQEHTELSDSSVPAMLQNFELVTDKKTEAVPDDDFAQLQIMNENTEQIQGNAIRVTLNHRSILLEPKAENAPYLFLDMLNYVDIDPTKPQGDIVLRVNNTNASYLQEITEGDEIEIYWSQRGL